jgi:hypothetical protein
MLKPIPPVSTSTFQAYIQQTWPASLCLQSIASPCDKVRNYTEFVVTDVGNSANNLICSTDDDTKFDQQRDVDSFLLRVWAAPYNLAIYWG